MSVVPYRWSSFSFSSNIACLTDPIWELMKFLFILFDSVLSSLLLLFFVSLLIWFSWYFASVFSLVEYGKTCKYERGKFLIKDIVLLKSSFVSPGNPTITSAPIHTLLILSDIFNILSFTWCWWHSIILCFFIFC